MDIDTGNDDSVNPCQPDVAQAALLGGWHVSSGSRSKFFRDLFRAGSAYSQKSDRHNERDGGGDGEKKRKRRGLVP